MHVPAFLAQTAPSLASPELGPAEVLFFKIAGLILILLWITYLVKEIFFAKSDAHLIASLTQNSVQLAVMNTNIAHLADASKEQREREKEMWVVINGIRRSLTTIAEDHAHLEGQAAAHGINPEPRRNPIPR